MKRKSLYKKGYRYAVVSDDSSKLGFLYYKDLEKALEAMYELKSMLIVLEA